ncbi:8-oxo-dGTP diphosphatase [Candidatus Saccharibacteria bacterium]|nr:8-oxo-dGTP diphosphatase [Candidatus Saccharibacteria bacterium]
MKKKVCTLLFLIKGDEILLAMKKRGFGSDRFNGVGGKLDLGETVEQALVRECEEEIEVTPIKYYKVAEHDFIGKNKDGSKWSMYVHAYICDEWRGDPTETEEMAPKWFNIKDIPYKNMWQDDKYWLPQVLEGKKVFCTFTFDENDNMLTHDVKEVEKLPNE